MGLPGTAVDAGHAYASLDYSRSLSHAGQPLAVPAWRTPVLLRPIPGAADRVDAMGCYPVCIIAADADIAGGMDTIRAAGAVSVVLVSDPLCGIDSAALTRHFPFCRPFKTHYVIDGQAGLSALSRHHRDEVRRGEKRAAARQVSMQDPVWQDRWAGLYAGLVAHRGIAGLQAFSAEAFRTLARLPADSLLAFAAEAPDGEILAMQLWIRHGDYAYSHLSATSKAGYRASASYVVYAAAIHHLRDCKVLDLGGGVGMADDPANSLAVFKQGFANAAVTSILCGAVLDQAAYAQLATGQGGSFFPAYRAPR